MATSDTTPDTPTWPLAPGEHPHLPRLICELTEATPQQHTPRGKTTREAHPATARIQISPLHVLTTANPDRLRHWAQQLDAIAHALETEHQHGHPGQQTLPQGS